MFPTTARLLVVLLLCWCANARAGQATTGGIDSQGDCFSGRTYDQWMDDLWEKNSVIAYLLIRWKFPEDEYDRYQRSLDCRYITYRSDQHLVSGWLVRPKRHAGRDALPVVIYNRGGNRGFGALTFAHLFTHVFPLAERGYLVAASQYRGVTSPQDARASPDEFGGRDVRDVTRLVGIVAGLPDADRHNIFMIGQSRGAIMTFRALLETPVPIRAVAIYSGVYDVHDLVAFRPAFDQLFEILIPGYRGRRKAELDRRSVTRWTARLPAGTGVLMFHGDRDERAPLGSARKLDGQLARLGRPHKLVVFPGESHFLDGVRTEVRDQTLRWFERHMSKPVADGGVTR